MRGAVSGELKLGTVVLNRKLSCSPSRSAMPPTSCKLPIKAIPNAPRSAVVGWLGDALKVKVHAPALEGRANDELCDFILDPAVEV